MKKEEYNEFVSQAESMTIEELKSQTELRKKELYDMYEDVKSDIQSLFDSIRYGKFEVDYIGNYAFVDMYYKGKENRYKFTINVDSDILDNYTDEITEIHLSLDRSINRFNLLEINPDLIEFTALMSEIAGLKFNEQIKAVVYDAYTRISDKRTKYTVFLQQFDRRKRELENKVLEEQIEKVFNEQLNNIREQKPLFIRVSINANSTGKEKLTYRKQPCNICPNKSGKYMSGYALRDEMDRNGYKIRWVHTDRVKLRNDKNYII